MHEGQLRGIRRRVTASWRACHCPEICCSLGVQRYDIYLDCAWILEEIICKASTNNQSLLVFIDEPQQFLYKREEIEEIFNRCWVLERAAAIFIQKCGNKGDF